LRVKSVKVVFLIEEGATLNTVRDHGEGEVENVSGNLETWRWQCHLRSLISWRECKTEVSTEILAGILNGILIEKPVIIAKSYR
jgi:hypothetical protein